MYIESPECNVAFTCFQWQNLVGNVTGNTDNVCQRVPAAPHRVAQQHLEAGLILQERQEGHLPNHDHPQPLRLALQHEEDILHGQVSFPAYFMSYLL